MLPGRDEVVERQVLAVSCRVRRSTGGTGAWPRLGAGSQRLKVARQRAAGVSTPRGQPPVQLTRAMDWPSAQQTGRTAALDSREKLVRRPLPEQVVKATSVRFKIAAQK